jgi:transcriptional regulator with XRE-family HTH domain
MSYGESVNQTLHNPRMAKIWQKIKQAREEAGLSQGAIGDACGGITRNAVSLWETENEDRRTYPSVDKLQIIASLTDRPISWFFDEPQTTRKSSQLDREAEALFSQLEHEQVREIIRDFARDADPKDALDYARLFFDRVEDGL